MLAQVSEQAMSAHVFDAVLPENLCKLVDGHAALRVTDCIGKLDLGGVGENLLFKSRVLFSDDFKCLRQNFFAGKSGAVFGDGAFHFVETVDVGFLDSHGFRCGVGHGNHHQAVLAEQVHGVFAGYSIAYVLGII